jgi:NtrC-family two-component system response regulator AlgB
MHARSPRKGRAFVTVSWPSLSRELLESELFGHVKGAFTGALGDTQGKVAAADGGTLLLDEIGDLPLEVQSKLLRLLQEREYERVGEAKPRRANVRVISATNRELAEAVREGRFREDLYYRLNVITLRLPPLRERLQDVERIAKRR